MMYHYACLNLSSTHNLAEFKKSWQCPSCDNITRRRINDNTPIRNRHSPDLNETDMSIDIQTPTKKNLIKSDSSILETITKLLNDKLEENKHSILGEIKNTIQTEILQSTERIFHELNIKTNKIMDEQILMNNQIDTLNKTIQQINNEKEKLQEEMRQMQNKILSINEDETKEKYETSKIFVLYGLTEYDRETENELHYRITKIFQDLLHIDLTGYIEEISRIGKKANRRPVIVELLSKKMTKYILQNGRCLKNTGLFVSEYLDRNELIRRRALQEKLRLARQNGHHAVIKNNKLFIDGNVDKSPYLEASSTQPPQQVQLSHITNRNSEGPSPNTITSQKVTSHRHTFR